MAQNVQQVENLIVKQETNTVNIESVNVESPEVWTPGVEPSVVEGTQERTVQELTDRWNYLGVYEWKANTDRHDVVAKIGLPSGLKNLNHQNWQVFRAYQYGKFDIGIKMQVNASRFHIGQLQLSYAYHFNKEAPIVNVFTMSQRPHVVYQVGSSDNIEFTIPYNSVVDYMGLRDGDYDNIKDFATLYVLVLSPLQCTTSVTKNVQCTFLYKLSNVRVHGLRSIQAQMMRYVMAGLKGVTNQIMADFNRDKPTRIDKQVVIPHASSSWSTGTNDLDTANVLRLDPMALTPHEGTPSNEMLVKELISKYSLFEIYKWNPQSKLIAVVEVKPIEIVKRLVKDADATRQRLAWYQDTIVGNIASCFSYWRGSLEMRFDLVSGPFHTGRLMVAFIPGKKIDKVSYEILAQSYFSLFNVRDQVSFTFEVPFVCSRKWANNYCMEGNVRKLNKGIGYVYLFAANSLGLIDQVPREIEILSYVRAHSSFELAVPASTCYGLATDDIYLNLASGNLLVRDSSMYIGEWRNFMNGTKYICRYGPVTDHVTQCIQGETGRVYTSSSPYQGYVNGKLTLFSYFVIPMDPLYVGYKYLVPFSSFAAARAYIRSLKDGRYDHNLAITWEKDGPYGPNPQSLVFHPMPMMQEEGDVLAQMDNRHITTNVAQPLPSVQVTSSTSYNESFADLKDLCRRYQFYTDFMIRAENRRTGSVLAKIPLLPCGMPLHLITGDDVSEMQNRVRNGVIPLIGSAFRFFKGGLRFKLVISSKSKVVVRISHHPDEHLGEASIHFPTGEGYLDYVGAGYASYAQSSKINEIYEIEVPFYSPYSQILNDRKFLADSLSKFDNLGTLVISTLGATVKENINVQIYYSLADDARFKCFMGFLPVIKKDEIPYYHPKPQIETFVSITEGDLQPLEVRVSSFASEMKRKLRPKKRIIPQLTDTERDSLEDEYEKVEAQMKVEPQGLFSIFASHTEEKMNETMDEAKETMQEVKNSVSELTTFVKGAPDAAKNVMDYMMQIAKEFGTTFVEKTCDIFFQIAQVIANANVRSIGIAVAAILVKIVGLPVDAFARITDWVRRLFRIVFPSNEQMNEGEPAVAQDNPEPIRAQVGEDKIDSFDICTIVSDLVGFIGAMSFVKPVKPGSGVMKIWGSAVVDMCAHVPRQSNQAFSFIERTVALVGKVWKWAICSSEPDGGFVSELMTEHESLGEWYKRSQELVSVERREELFQSPVLMKEILACSIIGRSLMNRMVSSGWNDSRCLYIRSITSQLQKVVDELQASHLSPSTKYEPMVVYMHGPPGCGKSSILGTVAKEMLKARNFYTYSTAIYVRNYGNAYWNGVKNQPILMTDDFGCTDDHLKIQIDELFAIKSVTPFNPAIAELENKKTLYNPRIYVIASNTAFPKSNTIADPRAVYRRRDILVHARMRADIEEEGYKMVADIYADSERFTKKFGDVQKMLKEYGHLEFRIAKNSSDENTEYGHWMLYPEFLKYMINRFEVYDARETRNFANRVATQNELFPKDDATVSSSMLQDIINKFDEFSHLKGSHEEFLKQYSKDPGVAKAQTGYWREYKFGEYSFNARFMEQLGGREVAVRKDWLTTDEKGAPALNIRSDIIGRRSYDSEPIYKENLDVSDMLRYGDDSNFYAEVAKAGMTPGCVPLWYFAREPINMYELPLDSYDPYFKDPKRYAPGRYLRMQKSIQATFLFDVHLWEPFEDDLYRVASNLYYASASEKFWRNMSVEEDADFRYLVAKGYNRTELHYYDADLLKRLRIACEQDESKRKTKNHSVVRNTFQYPMLPPLSVSACCHAQKNFDLLEKSEENGEIVHYLLRSEDTLGTHLDDIQEEKIKICPKFQPCGAPDCPLLNMDYAIQLYVYLNFGQFHNNYKPVPKENLPKMLHGVSALNADCPVANKWLPNPKLKEKWMGIRSVMWKAYDYFLQFLQWLNKFKAVIATTLAIVGMGAMLLNNQTYRDAWSMRYDPVGTAQRMAARDKKYNSEEAQMHASGDTRTFGSKKGGSKLSNLRKMKFSGARAQSAFEDILKSMDGNFGYISCSFKNQLYKQRFIGVCGSNIIATKHFFEVADYYDVDYITVEYGAKKVNIEIPYSAFNVELLSESSVCIATVKGNYLPMFRDIRKHIATFDELEELPTRGFSVQYGAQTKVVQTPLELRDRVEIEGDKEYKPQVLETVIEYTLTAPGLCGCPLLCDIRGSKLVGVHVAGTKSVGFAQPIWREMFDTLYCRGIKGQAQLEVECLDKPLVEAEKVIELGTIPRDITTRLSDKTRIVPSVLYEKVFPSVMEPAILSAKDERWEHDKSPLYYGIQKHGKDLRCFPPSELSRALDNQLEMLLTCKPLFVFKENLTDAEVFEGIPGKMKGLRLTTSEGYPLALERPQGYHDKRWLFDYVEEDGLRKFKGYKPALQEVIDHNSNLRRQSIVPLTIFSDTLKDCRLPVEKVKVAGKTRIFSCSPVEYTIAVKKSFGAFQMAFLDKRFDNETAIGIDCNGPDWTQLARYLGEVSYKNIVTGDYKSFGDTLQPEVLYGCFQNILKWYDNYFESDNSERQVLIHEVLNSRRLALNYLYQVVCGIPSGFPLTVEMNSLVNSIYMRICFLLIAKDLGIFVSMKDFNRYTRIVTYGDDLIMSVHEDFKWFNFNSISRKLAEFKIQFTCAEKDRVDVPDFMPLHECQFLKRTFQLHPTRKSFWVGCLPKSSIEECINWTWQGNDPEKAAFEVARAVLEGAFAWGEAYYTEVRFKIGLAISKYFGKHWQSMTWKEMDFFLFCEVKNKSNLSECVLDGNEINSD